MAESTDRKKPKAPDSFADDLDSMLNLDDGTEQQVGLIDDDDAIDRLLMDDVFEQDHDDAAPAALNDIDQLIADGVEKDESFNADFDEFGDDTDDFFSDFQIKPKVEQTAIKPNGASSEAALADEFELSDMAATGETADVTDDELLTPEVESDSEVAVNEQFENMTEIDEFSDDSDDFLMADFDIAPADEDEDESEQAGIEPVEPSPAPEMAQPVSDEVFGDDDMTLQASQPVAERLELVSPEESIAEEMPAQTGTTGSEQSPLITELSAQLLGLTSQLDDLKKQQALLKQQIHGKTNQDELQGYSEDIDALKAEQRKIKRNLNAIVSNKPVSAYVANAIAVIALIVGGGLGIQGYIAKKQLEEVAAFVSKLQDQINTPQAMGAADAAEKELLRKRLDEMAQANSTATSQLAELTQALQGDGGHAVGALGQKFDELNSHDMQMGAAIEALQNKVAALEKGKPVVAKKTVAKKPAVAQDNWMVNLVAYKQDWYAKRKAEEFASKGVQAKVSRVESKGEIWYRLAVDGFKTQYDAAAYAARVKKTLNLDSVWLAKVKH